jgi:sugar/nucleoside kinase (ribokinase family)
MGGTSAGKALNLRRLGLDVTLCTVLGADDIGDRISAALRAKGITVIARRSVNGSERHVNLMDPAGRRLSIYLTLPQVEAEESPGQDAPPTAAADAALASADAVVVDLADHSRRVLPLARALGRAVWCDLHDYDGRSTFHTEFRDAADYLFLSDERLPDPHRFLQDQVAAGKRLVVCTRGARGALALVPGGDIIEVPAERVPEVVDTNGAGDAFFAGFLDAHLARRPLRDCLTAGARSAATCIASPDLSAEP